MGELSSSQTNQFHINIFATITIAESTLANFVGRSQDGAASHLSAPFFIIDSLAIHHLLKELVQDISEVLAAEMVNFRPGEPRVTGGVCGSRQVSLDTVAARDISFL